VHGARCYSECWLPWHGCGNGSSCMKSRDRVLTFQRAGQVIICGVCDMRVVIQQRYRSRDIYITAKEAPISCLMTPVVPCPHVASRRVVLFFPKCQAKGYPPLEERGTTISAEPPRNLTRLAQTSDLHHISSLSFHAIISGS
jgi:hypothetical protein